jgi:hypothetical protein
MCDKSISQGKADLILLNARCKERMRILRVFWHGIHFPGLENCLWSEYSPWTSTFKYV